MIPATVTPTDNSLVTNGVININVEMNVLGVHYQTVSDEVNKKLNQIPGLEYHAKVLVMPDAVNFKGGAAWAGLFGDTIWTRNVFASLPTVQVHGKCVVIRLFHSCVCLKREI